MAGDRVAGDAAVPVAEDVVAAGHFTTMQLRRGRVQGLDLHLARLVAASEALYGTAPDADALRAELRKALCAAAMEDGDCTLRTRIRIRAEASCRSGYSRDSLGWTPIAAVAAPTGAGTPAEATAPADAGAPMLQVGIDIEPPLEPSPHPMCVRTHAGQRACPGIKHLALDAQLEARRGARAAGFDDALLVDAEGVIAEGTFWNLVLHDGEGIVWPDSPMLDGTAQQRLRQALQRVGMPQRRAAVTRGALEGIRAAFALNARGLQVVGAVDGHAFAGDPAVAARLRRLLAEDSWDRP